MSAKTKIKSKKKTPNLDRYSGEWVAFVEEKVIAHKKSLKELMEEVKRKHLEKDASVFLVPRKDEGPYVLIIL
jgi:peptidyl-tRNA hydrolase